MKTETPKELRYVSDKLREITLSVPVEDRDQVLLDLVALGATLLVVRFGKAWTLKTIAGFIEEMGEMVGDGEKKH